MMVVKENFNSMYNELIFKNCKIKNKEVFLPNMQIYLKIHQEACDK